MRGVFLLAVLAVAVTVGTVGAQTQQQMWVASGGMWITHRTPYDDCSSAQSHADWFHWHQTQLPCAKYTAMDGHYMICPFGYDPNSNDPPPLIVCPTQTFQRKVHPSTCPQPICLEPSCQPACPPVCERPRLFPLFRRCR